MGVPVSGSNAGCDEERYGDDVATHELGRAGARYVLEFVTRLVDFVVLAAVFFLVVVVRILGAFRGSVVFCDSVAFGVFVARHLDVYVVAVDAATALLVAVVLRVVVDCFVVVGVFAALPDVGLFALNEVEDSGSVRVRKPAFPVVCLEQCLDMSGDFILDT